MGSPCQLENREAMFKPKFTLADTTFRELLKDLRVQQGLSQRDLASKLKVPQSYVSKYETGERRLDFVETVHVCGVLGIGIAEFAKMFAERVAKRTGRRRVRNEA